MATDIGARIGIDGEKAFRDNLSAINSQLKNLGSEMKTVVSAFAGMEDSEEALAAKGDVLLRSIETSAKKIEILQAQSERAKNKLSTLANALENAKNEFGENSAEALKAQNAYNRQVTTVNRLETQINLATVEMNRMGSEMEALGRETDDLSDGFEDAGDSAVNFGDMLKSNVLSQLIVDGIKEFSSAVKNMAGDFISSAAAVKAETSQFEQTFGDMGDEASSAIGRVADTSGILETRLNALGAQIYAFARSSGGDTAESMSIMEKSLQAAADGAAYYDKSLEETTETLQSFLKGNFSNDAALGLSCTETTRNAAAMELFGQKYKDLSEIQKQETLLQMVLDAQKLSGAMGQAAREADGWENVQGNLNEAWRQFQANVGEPFLESLIPIIQEVTDKLSEMTAEVDWEVFSNTITGFVSMVIDNREAVISAIAGVGTAFVSWNVASMIMGVVTAVQTFQKANESATVAQALLNAVMGANPAVKIATIVLGLVTALVTFIATNEEARAKVAAAWEAIKSGVSGAIDKGKAKIAELKESFSKIGDEMKQIGRNIVDGLTNGITEKWENLKAKVSAKVDSLKNIFTRAEGFDTHSPSKWAQKVGGWVMEGLGIGIEKDKTAVNAAQSTVEEIKDVVNEGAEEIAEMPMAAADGMEAALPYIERTAQRVGDSIKRELNKTNEEIEALQKKANDEQAAKELKQYKDNLAEKQKELAKAEKKNKQKILDEIAKIESDWNEKQTQAARNAEQTALQERLAAIQQFQQEYESALSSIESKQENLQDKLSDYGSLFERVQDESGKETFSLGDLDAEIKKIQEYSKAIDKMREKGISDGLMGEISAMSVDDALDYMDKLSSMSDKKFDAYMQKYDEKQRLAAEAAEKFYQSEFVALEQEYSEKLPEALGGVKEKLYQAGTEAAAGFTAGVADAASIEGKISGMVASASEVEQGPTMEQIVSGLQGQEPVLTEYIQGLEMKLLELMTGYRVEYVDMGEMMMDGLAEGIRNGQSGVINAVAEVVAAAIAKAKEELDINSPSGVFMDFGEYSMEGYEIGVKNRLKAAVRTMQDSMNTVMKVPKTAAVSASGGVNKSRTYTYGDINVHIDKVSSKREAKTLAQEIEFLRRQQDTGKGGNT